MKLKNKIIAGFSSVLMGISIAGAVSPTVDAAPRSNMYGSDSDCVVIVGVGVSDVMIFQLQEMNDYRKTMVPLRMNNQ